MLLDAIKARISLINLPSSESLDAVKTYLRLNKISFTMWDGSTDTMPQDRVWILDKVGENGVDKLNFILDSGDSVLTIGGEHTSQAIQVPQIIPTNKEISLYLEDELGLAKTPSKNLAKSLSGDSLSDIINICKFCVQNKEMNKVGIAKWRKILTKDVVGLQEVKADLTTYVKPHVLKEWLDLNIPYLHSDILKLRPRGLLFVGEGGTGKTLGAKYVAEAFGVPLYKLDIGAMLSKWSGEAEANLREALMTIEQKSPCTLLLDEVDKLFVGESKSSYQTLFASLLWWLQEHTQSIVTVMTANELDKIPPELYRSGRVDKIVHFGKATMFELKSLYENLTKYFDEYDVIIPEFEYLYTQAGDYETNPEGLELSKITLADFEVSFMEAVKKLNNDD